MVNYWLFECWLFNLLFNFDWCIPSASTSSKFHESCRLAGSFPSSLSCAGWSPRGIKRWNDLSYLLQNALCDREGGLHEMLPTYLLTLLLLPSFGRLFQVSSNVIEVCGFTQNKMFNKLFSGKFLGFPIIPMKFRSKNRLWLRDIGENSTDFHKIEVTKNEANERNKFK